MNGSWGQRSVYLGSEKRKYNQVRNHILAFSKPDSHSIWPKYFCRVLKGPRGVEGEGVFLGNPKDSGREDWGTLGNMEESYYIWRIKRSAKLWWCWVICIQILHCLGWCFIMTQVKKKHTPSKSRCCNVYPRNKFYILPGSLTARPWKIMVGR